MKKLYALLFAFILVGCYAPKVEKPNVIIIMTDDLGYESVSAYGSTMVHTPHIDRLVNGGVCFTNGYAASASNWYALMTGVDPSKDKDAGTHSGDASLIIGEHQLTLPRMMGNAGYTTGAIGNWSQSMQGKSPNGDSTVLPGAKDIGFDYFFLMEEARWKDGDMTRYSVNKAKSFVSEHREEPFFLYYSLHQPRVPDIPHSRSMKSTSAGSCEDIALGTDWCVGELMAHLEKEDLVENTIIVFSSDNITGVDTRVPFSVYWKGKITPVISDALVYQMDLMASLGKLLHANLPKGLDSQECLDAFMGKTLTARKVPEAEHE